MNEMFKCDDKDTLIAYLYGEIDDEARASVEQHLTTCVPCAQEVDELQAVRRDLQAWRAPDADLDFAVVPRPAKVLTSSRWRERRLPVWAQAAAAVLLVAAAAAIANVRVQYGTDGFIVSTGWRSTAPAAPSTAPVQSSPEQWRPALNALAEEVRSVRTELGQVKQAASSVAVANRTGASTVDAGALLRRVQDLIEESEQRQRQEFALRIAQTRAEMDMQRRVDLQSISFAFGNLRGDQVKGQQQFMNALRQVSTRQIP